MLLSEIKNLLEAELLCGKENMEKSVEWAYCADLMSDVLAYSITNSLLITGLTNAQVVRTADVADIRAVVFIQNKRPDSRTIALATERGIPLLATEHSMFDACGRLFEKGLRSQPYLDAV
jgi:predicted transcriptional regulator